MLPSEFCESFIDLFLQSIQVCGLLFLTEEGLPDVVIAVCIVTFLMDQAKFTPIEATHGLINTDLVHFIKPATHDLHGFLSLLDYVGSRVGGRVLSNIQRFIAW